MRPSSARTGTSRAPSTQWPGLAPEHDSHGELVFAVIECFRFTSDRAFLAEMWPAVQRAIAYHETLRATRLGPEFDAPALRARRGLLPESVSHEGYLAHPVHAYWDDFWALRGTPTPPRSQRARRGGARRAGSRRARRVPVALRESIALTIAERRSTTCRDRSSGPTSTRRRPPTPSRCSASSTTCRADVLERTFDQYLAGVRRRRSGEMDWNNYSAYEIRILGALVRLGRRADTTELAEFFLDDRRPRAWNQWPEISWRNPRSPGHLGDVPHTWISAEYVLATVALVAYERDADDALVLGAGVPPSWLDESEVAVRALPTRHGLLDFRLARDGSRALVASIGPHSLRPAGRARAPAAARPSPRVRRGERARGRDVRRGVGDDPGVAGRGRAAVLALIRLDRRKGSRCG
jgi:hypothetical protein